MEQSMRAGVYTSRILLLQLGLTLHALGFPLIFDVELQIILMQ